MRGESGDVSIWFFIGSLLAFYGVLILGYGIYAWTTPPAEPRVLAELHADVWWGALLVSLGGFYSIKYFPGKS